MLDMPKKIDNELKARAVRLVTENQQEYPNLTAACEAAGRKVGVGKESVRRWVRQAEVDSGDRQGRTSEELAEIKELKARIRRLESDNQILKEATVFFAGELVPLALRAGRCPHPATVWGCPRLKRSARGNRGFHRSDARPGARGRVDLCGPARAGLPGRRAHLPGLEGRQPAGGCPHDH